MSQISPQWLAGFFDGEGCINITVAGKYRRCTLRLFIVNTNYELLAKIKDEYGGILHRKRKQIKSWKPFCSLKWSNRQARLLLERIGPYIVLKRQQLDLAMKFLALRNDPDRFCFSTVPAPPLSRWNSATRSVRNISHAMLEKEAAIKESMHALNRKGVSVDAIQ